MLHGFGGSKVLDGCVHFIQKGVWTPPSTPDYTPVCIITSTNEHHDTAHM